MTAPRQILRGTTYLVTRRCSERRFLLRPSRLTSDIFAYVLAVASRRFNVQVHAFCVLSNHSHLVVTDRDARLPEFEQYLHGVVARAVNSTLGRWESFWAPASYSAVALTSREDVVAKTAYVLANPVAAGLVHRARAWPGLWSAPEQIGGPPIVATRPSAFFSSTGTMPEQAELALVVPPGFSSSDEFRGFLSDALTAAEEKGRRVVESAGRGFLGVARVLAQRPFARPASGEAHRKLNPRVAARDKWKRVEALTRLAAFLERYRTALGERRSGNLCAIFPSGTYLMRIAHGVPCAAT